ncbi:MAG: hypothetical protein ACRCT2_10530 [Plesiomonas shigelloides]
MISDFYFKFSDKEVIADHLGLMGFYRNMADELVHDNRQVSVSEVGIISVPSGEVIISDGEEIPVMQQSDGWHVNIRSLDDELSEKLASLPNQEFTETPIQVWV